MLVVLPGSNISITAVFPTRSDLHQDFFASHFTPLRWIRIFFFLWVILALKPVAMLRRRSEFFLFLDDTRAGKSGKEEHKEEHHPSPCEDYLGVLLQMKMTSDVSEQTGFPQVCSAPTGIKRKLELPTKLDLCHLCMLEFSLWYPGVSNLSSYRDSQHGGGVSRCCNKDVDFKPWSSCKWCWQ